jgi:hypothetical protein
MNINDFFSRNFFVLKKMNNPSIKPGFLTVANRLQYYRIC